MLCSWWSASTFALSPLTNIITSPVTAVIAVVLRRTTNTAGARAVCLPTSAGAAITTDTRAMYTSLGADAGMKYPSTGAGAQTRLTLARCTLPLALAPRSRLTLAQCTCSRRCTAITAGARAMWIFRSRQLLHHFFEARGKRE